MHGIIGIVQIFFFLVVKAKGAVTAAEILRFNEGDSVAQLGNISEVKPLHIRLLQKRNNWKVVYQYCSPGEEQKGCLNITSPRISARIVDENVFIDLHNVTASDAGFYIFDVTGGNQGKEIKEKRFHVTVEPLDMNSSTEPIPSTYTKPENTSFYSTLAICFLIVAALLLGYIFSVYRYIKTPALQKIRIPGKRTLEQHRPSSGQSSDSEDEATSGDFNKTSDNETLLNLQSPLIIGGQNPPIFTTPDVMGLSQPLGNISSQTT